VPVIEVENLSKSYRGHVAVEGVSFSVEEGEIFGVVGPNGAGKTTTVECIEGLRRPDGGSVRVLGLDPDKDRRGSCARGWGRSSRRASCRRTSGPARRWSCTAPSTASRRTLGA
jgi:ABC-type branched-subunit amino acid transport system ATPase component